MSIVIKQLNSIFFLMLKTMFGPAAITQQQVSISSAQNLVEKSDFQLFFATNIL